MISNCSLGQKTLLGIYRFYKHPDHKVEKSEYAGDRDCNPKRSVSPLAFSGNNIRGCGGAQGNEGR